MPIASLPDTIYDSLLIFLSQSLQGNWAEFKRAVSGMDISDRPYWVAQRMFLLAHLDIDLDSADRQWNVTPSVFTQIGEREWYWSGFRSITLMNQVFTLLEDRGRLVVVLQENAPSAIFVLADPEKIEEVAESFGITMAGRDTTSRIMSGLPKLTEIRPEPLPHSKPFGKKVEYYQASNASWVLTTPDAVMTMGGTQLIRYGNDFDRTVSIMIDRRFYGIRYGLSPYYFFHQIHHSALTYYAQSDTLVAPLTAQIPSLYGRALILQSGRLPERHERRIHYIHVTQVNAELAAQALGQSLEVVND